MIGLLFNFDFGSFWRLRTHEINRSHFCSFFFGGWGGCFSSLQPAEDSFCFLRGGGGGLLWLEPLPLQGEASGDGGLVVWGVRRVLLEERKGGGSCGWGLLESIFVTRLPRGAGTFSGGGGTLFALQGPQVALALASVSHYHVTDRLLHLSSVCFNILVFTSPVH